MVSYIIAVSVEGGIGAAGGLGGDDVADEIVEVHLEIGVTAMDVDGLGSGIG